MLCFFNCPPVINVLLTWDNFSLNNRHDEWATREVWGVTFQRRNWQTDRLHAIVKHALVLEPSQFS
jgi:hypothetical protein